MSTAQHRSLRERVKKSRHFLMLALLMVLCLASPLLSSLLAKSLFLGAIAAVLWLDDAGSRHKNVAITVLSLPLLAFIIGHLLFSMHARWRSLCDGSFGVSVQVLSILLFAYCARLILCSLLRAERVTLDELLGTVNLYLVMGFVWASLYALLERCVPGSFSIELSQDPLFAHLGPERLREAAFVYFSFVTQATQGYGDITPQTVIAQRLVVIQTVMGQFYIAVVVAYLVTTHMKQKPQQTPGAQDAPAEQRD